MSSNSADTDNKQNSVEVTDWNGLVRYAEFLCRNTKKNFKICMIDEEQEQIRIENKDEFDTNVKFARDHGLNSLILSIYIDDVHTFDGIYHIEKPKIVELNLPKVTAFPTDKLQNLRNNVLVDKWYIPVKLDEALGACLTSAIILAQEGQLDSNVECKEFIEKIVPEAFRKLQTTQSVYSWPREIQHGIFDMIELLVDLVGTRIRHAPVPTTLLNILALTFDTNTTFSLKHKDEQLPTNRNYTLDDEEFLRTTFTNRNECYGWLRSFIQRFIAQNGLKNLRALFESINTTNPTVTSAIEYNCLLKLFSKCHQCIELRRFRLLFTRPIRQAIQYLLQMKKTTHRSNEQLNELNETLIEVCFNYEMNDEVNEILEISSISKTEETPIAPLITPLEKMTISKKSKYPDCYEQLAENIRSLTMNNGDIERKNIKKQRTDEQVTVPLFSRHHATDCTTDDILSSSEKRLLKRKHRREQQRHLTKKENTRSNTKTVKTYDRSNPDDILRFFAPMKIKIASLYDDLQTATRHGNLREVLKIEEKLKLLRPYSARFIADENTPDGTPMQPGQVFRKGWMLLNDGSMPWSSDDIELINLTDGIKVVNQPIVPVTAPHSRALITVDYTCNNEPGTYESKWILSFRHRTFGPMIWCSIQVGQSTIEKSIPEVKETFEFIDIPLPSCFDLSKPYETISNNNPRRSSFILPRSNSTTTQSESLINTFQSPDVSDNDSLSTFAYSPLLSTIENSNEMPLIELTPAIPNTTNEERQQQALRANQSLDFVDSVVTNIFSVAKHAGSTAKAIFNTLQANDEFNTPVQEQQPLIETNNSNNDDYFEHVEENENSILSNNPIDILIEMGFANRQTNQLLLSENNNDLNRVIEILTGGSIEDID
ncbi:unnamed protein product [Adineta steineri]|uniref:UBA domain-containing protein n=1 Tax=Adineta steineri TaxID=433720 RepID=A0A815FZ99_9BILA|nr:unnamed protein product [Adineta steineri]CAF3761285.1 unnamed protein product [Adineta steineri]